LVDVHNQNLIISSKSYDNFPPQLTIDIQFALKRTGFYKGEIDGIYGEETENAVKAFQNDLKKDPANNQTIISDGIFGPQTAHELHYRLYNVEYGANLTN
jgi:hypothetical protein